MSPARRVKAADVAEEAGVSTATVSYVLNDTPGQKISEATADRVRETAERLGYISNPAARALARGESSFVIIDMSVFPRSETSDGAFYGLTDYLENQGYTTLLTWWGPENWERHLVKFAISTSASRVISTIPVSKPTRDALISAGVQTISSLMASPEELVLPLQFAATEQVDFLADHGHTHLLYVPETDPALAMLNTLREGSGARAATRRGLHWNAVAGSSSTEEHRTHLRRALAEHPKTTALVAYNDHVALRTLSALQALKIPVPERVSLIGVDNLDFSSATYPPLTTVEYSYSVGALAPGTLDAFVEGEGKNGLVSDVSEAIHVEVVKRESVQVLPRAART